MGARVTRLKTYHIPNCDLTGAFLAEADADDGALVEKSSLPGLGALVAGPGRNWLSAALLNVENAQAFVTTGRPEKSWSCLLCPEEIVGSAYARVAALCFSSVDVPDCYL